MDITLNGTIYALDASLSVDGLIKHLGLDANKIAVEINQEVIPRSSFADIAVTEGDQVEIIHFIGGG